MSLSLAVKYRPHDWASVVEQDSIKIILQNQLDTGEIKNSYLFVGGAGTGKTTSARIFANELNKGMGSPIELDAASNNSVDDMRDLIKQAQSKSLDSEYKCFIIDECHMITIQGWNALLKLIEEPPAKSIFIFCTTNPEKIPKTILSRVQRYDFKRISQDGIVKRLKWICDVETKNIMEEMGDQDSTTDIEWAREQHLPIIEYDMDALEYISKLSDGGMRDAITLTDKCLAYSTDLTLENVVKALGTTDYETMFDLLEYLLHLDTKQVIMKIEEIHNAGKDLKLFIHMFVGFLLDMCKLSIDCDWKYVSIPHLREYEKIIDNFTDSDWSRLSLLLKEFIKLDTSIKYSSTPKIDIECAIIGVC